MSIKAQLRAIEHRMKDRHHSVKVHFFNGHDEYMEAYNKNQINKQDITFIDDILEIDN